MSQREPLVRLTDTASMNDWYDCTTSTTKPGRFSSVEGQPPSAPVCDPTEAGSGLDLVVRDGRDKAELTEDLAIAEQVLDEYGKKGAEDTISYNEYRNNRLATAP